MPTIREVARRAGVAPITVSRVVNGKGYVSEETRLRVEQAIADLRYVPNTLAQSLRYNRTNTLALIVSDITNPFWTTVARGVEDAASEQAFNVVFCNTDENPAEQDRYVKLLLQRQVDGFLLVPARDTPDSLEMIQQQGVPLVVLDREVRAVDVDTVRGDSEGGAYDLVRYLLGLDHRRIACVAGLATISSSWQRVEGYKRAFRDAGLEPDPALIYFGEFTVERGYQITEQILQTGLNPTGWFAANNFIAIGVLKALRQAGRRVPEDMSVVGFDDLPGDLLIDPFLTVAAQPAYDMGYRATELLLKRISGTETSAAQNIVLPTELVIRRSASYPPRTGSNGKNGTT